MKKKLCAYLIPLLLLTSCSLFQKDSYVGEWKLSLSGDYSATFDFNIGEELAISFSDMIVFQGNNYNARFKGKISEDGNLICDVSIQGMKVATLSGAIDYDKGSGVWSGAGMKGSWTAVKK